MFVGFELFQSGGVNAVVAFAVGDGEADGSGSECLRIEGGAGVLDGEVDSFADEFETRIAHEGTGQETCFAKNLKAVADTEYGFAAVGKIHEGTHDRRETGDGTATQVIAVGETAGQDDGREAVEAGFFMPYQRGGNA